MLAIRLQRLGRKAYPVYRVAVQEAWRHPSSGRVVAYVGNYNPHTKEVKINKELAQKYLNDGAQPTPRVIKLLKQEGVKLPKWVKEPSLDKQKAVKNPEKLRKNQPKEEAPVEAEVEAPETTEPAEAPAETTEEPKAEEKAEESSEEKEAETKE